MMDSLPAQIPGLPAVPSDTAGRKTIDSTGTSVPGFEGFTESLPNEHTDSISIARKDTITEPDDRASGFRDEMTQAPDIRNVISLSKIFWAIIFITIGYFIIKAINGILAVISERRVKYKGAIRRILPVVRIVGWSLVVYIIINGVFQPPAETIFAFFASVGVAIGFASQDLLKNIFGGLMILFDKPFQIGDKIESGKYYGEVFEIGLRSTRIVTPDDSVVTIPNSEMMNQSISNANSGENNCQVVAEFFFPVTIDTRRVRQIAVEAAQISQFVYLNKPILVVFSNVMNQGGVFLKMKLKAYVNDVRYEFPFQSEMTEIVLRELNKEGLLDEL
jgi:small-conductance mechanosensitive channel